MDRGLIERWNERVTDKDDIYIIGDFSFKNPIPYAEQLNGNKFMVVGNHDNYKRLTRTGLFEWVRHYYELKWERQLIVLCHYAFRVWNKSHHGSWHLYGHSHGSLPSHGKSMDVGVDSCNYKPISIYEIKEIMESKEIATVDHHGK